VTRRVDPGSIDRDPARQILHHGSGKPDIIDSQRLRSPTASRSGIPGEEDPAKPGPGRIDRDESLPVRDPIDGR
jgi:hypothetical protein